MAKTTTTCTLVATSLRRAMVPSDQATFTCCDIIDIMNEEMGIHILPVVLRSHEEYYVIDEDIPVTAETTKFKIPYRAVGNKTRDVQFVDNAGSFYEMTRISLEDRPEYQGSYSSNQFLNFYLQADEIVLMQNQASTGNIRVSYYLRPNELVKDNRAGQITAVGNNCGVATITSYANLVCTTADTITVMGTAFTASACAVVLGCATFQAATSNCATATSLAAQINGHATVGCLVTATVSCAVVTILADSSSTTLTLSYTDGDCNIGATVSGIRTVFTVSSFPTHFSCTTCFDFIQGKSPNKIIGFDRTITSLNSTAKTLTFCNCDLKTVNLFGSTLKDLSFSVGDYIMKKEETIIPQLPAELRPILAQRTAVKLLEALGDTEGMRNAQQELERMEHNAMELINNRVEGAPQKVRANHSPLRSALSNKSYRR